METLLPCPFCGSNDVSIFILEYSNKYKAVGCKCGAEGAAKAKKKEAVKAWNERAPFYINNKVKVY